MPPARDLVPLMAAAGLVIVAGPMPWLTIGVLIVLTPLAMVRLLAARGSTRLAWPAIGILAMAVVGTAVSPDRAVSLQRLSGIVLGVLALAAVQAHARSAGGFAAVMIVFVALATVAVAAGGAALLPAVTEMLPARAALQRTVPAATVHPNGVAGLVLMVLPGLLLLSMSRAVWARTETALAPRYRTRWTRPVVLRLGAAAICLAMLATLAASRSRSGIVALGAAIALALGDAARRGPSVPSCVDRGLGGTRRRRRHARRNRDLYGKPSAVGPGDARGHLEPGRDDDCGVPADRRGTQRVSFPAAARRPVAVHVSGD